MADRLKPSEYGGSDTHKTLGLQPAPHRFKPKEKLRVLYKSDPLEPVELPLDIGPIDG